MARDREINFQKFYKSFQNSYTICYERRNELKSKLNQGVSNVENTLKKTNYEKLSFVLEINCSNDARLSFRNEDGSKLLKYNKKIVSNISFYTIDIKNNTDTFYIVNDKNEEYLFNLNDYFADLLLDSEEEISIFKSNKTNILINLSSKNENEEEILSLKQKVKLEKENIKLINDQIKRFEDLLIKIKDYKTQNPLEYLVTISDLVKLAVSLSDQNKDQISQQNVKNQKKKNFTQNVKKTSFNSPVESTPHFGNEQDLLQDHIKDSGITGISNMKISEFQTEDLEVSRNESLNNLSNIDFLKNIDEDYTKAKPLNPLSIREEQEKSIDNSQMSALNNSQISENKLNAYAQKTKKITMDKIKSFKSFKTLNFPRKMENKYDNEFNNMDEKNKAVYNAVENFSSNVQTLKSPSNVNSNKTVSNPFNISSKINKYQKQTTFAQDENKAPSVKFKIENLSNTKENENLTTSSRNEQKNLNDINSNSFQDNISNNTFSRSKTQIIDNSFNDIYEERKTNQDSQNNYVNIDSKLKALVSDRKLKAEKVFKAGSLLSILNLGIKASPIFSCSKVNIAEMYLNAKKRKEENNE